MILTTIIGIRRITRVELKFFKKKIKTETKMKN